MPKRKKLDSVRLKVSAMSDFVYFQIIPFYLPSDEQMFQYFKKFKEEIDALTDKIVVAIPDAIESGDPKALGELFSKRSARYPGLQRSHLPCLWIEDGNKTHTIVRISNNPGDASRMVKILSDEAPTARSAAELAAAVQQKYSEIVIETSPEIGVIQKWLREFTMSKTTEKLIAVCFGAAFLVAILAMAVVFPSPTAFQYTVFRIVLAISAAGFAAMIPGFLEVTVNNYVRAGGALAVFVIIFFFSPANLVALPK